MSKVVDNAPLLERCFLFDAVEASYPIAGATGTIPAWLRGSYYVNGPARFERAGQRLKHWLDGDGMVCALNFTADGVRFTNRFVQTTKLKEEDAAGRFLFRGFGTSFEGDRLRRKVMLEPPINVSVHHWGGRLLAFGEQGVPIELDAATLETKGEYDFNGSLNEVSPFAAHVKADPVTGNLLNFGVSFSAKDPMLNVYEFDPTGELIRRRRHPMGDQHSLHDFGFTANRVVFYLSPLLMDFERFFSDNVSVMESLNWQPEKGARLLVAPRSDKTIPAFTVEIEPRYCLHLINCFEAEGAITVDVLEMDAPVYYEYQTIPDLFSNAPRCYAARYVIDLETKSLRTKQTLPYDLCPDFPAIDPHRTGQATHEFWMLGIGAYGEQGRKFFDQVVRGSFATGGVTDGWTVPYGEYLGGEPVYVPNPSNHREGVVIVQHLIPAQNEAKFEILNAWNLAAGPIATLPLNHLIHAGFHSSFHFA